MHFDAFPYILIHFQCIPIHFNAFRYISIHFDTFRCISMHFDVDLNKTMCGWVDGWMGGCVDGWMGGCTLANTPTCLAKIVRFASLERNECMLMPGH